MLKHLIVLLFFAQPVYSQFAITNLNDTTFIYEDTATKTYIPINDVYPVKVEFMGLIYKDTIRLYHNRKPIFSDTLSTMNEDGTDRFPYITSKIILQINQRHKNNIRFVFNRTSINVPIKYGYSILRISVAADIINGKNSITFYFEFTNQELGII